MNQRSQKSIQECLRQSDIQAQVWKSIQEARENITVTISRAANLFGFSESRLREWEKRGLLQTERSILSQGGKGSTGHRQYSSMELDKLAIIRVLLDQGYAPGEIPSDVDRLWTEIVGTGNMASSMPRVVVPESVGERVPRAHLPVDQRVEEMDRQEFWRYFVSQALRISLRLICEDIPDTLAGIVLPLEDRKLAYNLNSPEDLQQVGLSLVGWLGTNRSFYTFLDDAPVFEFPSDFRLERLAFSQRERNTADVVLDNVVVVVQRRARPLSLTPALVETVRRVLGLVYARVDSWRSAFDYARHDFLYQSHDLERVSNVAGDMIFNSLLERVVELGGKTGAGRDRWSFCALLLPRDAGLPIQQQILVVRAQTHRSPYTIGVTSIDQAHTDSLSQKAFLSGQIVYFADILPGQSMTTYQLPTALSRGAAVNAPVPEDWLEKETRSALAVPVLGDFGISAAVLYIASEEAHAFSRNDQRALRIISRMLEELLSTSQARRQIVGKIGGIISNPSAVDTSFQDFASETAFIAETEALLKEIQEKASRGEKLEGDLSIISVDIDSQSSLAFKHDNRVARDLSQQMGLRISRQIRFSNRYAASKLFHISADKYCWLLPGLSLEEARDLARQLKKVLQEDYLINPSYTTRGIASSHPILPENMLKLSGITVHVGVSSYTFQKLAELLQRYPEPVAAKSVHILLVAGIEEIMVMGKELGGNCIVSWDEDNKGYYSLA